MTATQNEELRRAVLHALAIRHPTVLPPAAIRSRLVGDRVIDFSPDEAAMLSALTFLTELGLLKTATEDLGSTIYWGATPEGVRANERGTIK